MGCGFGSLMRALTAGKKGGGKRQHTSWSAEDSHCQNSVIDCPDENEKLQRLTIHCLEPINPDLTGV